MIMIILAFNIIPMSLTLRMKVAQFVDELSDPSLAVYSNNLFPLNNYEFLHLNLF